MKRWPCFLSLIRLILWVGRLVRRFAMGYVVPAMPISCQLFRPPSVFPFFTTSPIACNLMIGRTTKGALQGQANGYVQDTIARFLAVPAGTDVRGAAELDGPGDFVLLNGPAYPRAYMVESVEDVAKGFPNEYRLCLLLPLSPILAGLSGNPCHLPVWTFPMT